MNQLIFRTNNDWTGVITRLTVGFILLPHGLQKMFGMFGGYGFSGTMDFFTKTAHLPWLIAFFVIVTEFFGSLSLIAGFATRFWSAAVIILMIGAIFTVHLPNGFFMNWDGSQKGEGFEYHLLMIGLALTTLISGGGKCSIDRKICEKHKKDDPHQG